MQDLATFSLFVRALPAHRGFVVAAGLQYALDRTSSVSKSPRGRLRAGGRPVHHRPAEETGAPATVAALWPSP